MRLCKRFDVKFEATEDWPVLSVEFSSLKDRDTNEVYEVICSLTAPEFITDLFDYLLVHRPSSEFCSQVRFPHTHALSEQGIGEHFKYKNVRSCILPSMPFLIISSVELGVSSSTCGISIQRDCPYRVIYGTFSQRLEGTTKARRLQP